MIEVFKKRARSKGGKKKKSEEGRQERGEGKKRRMALGYDYDERSC